MEMTIYPQDAGDAVCVSSLQWGLIGSRLLSVMSRGDPPRWPDSSSATSPTPQNLLDTSESEAGPTPRGHSDSKEKWKELSSSISVEDTSTTTTTGGGASFDEGRERRKLKCEDSSYDSDFDPCDVPSSPHPEDGHEDVSRTTSETLAAEFEEYVTFHPKESSVITPTRTAVTVLSSGTEATRTTTAQGNILSSAPILTLTEATPQPCILAPSFPSAAPAASYPQVSSRLATANPPSAVATSSSGEEKCTSESTVRSPDTSQSVASVCSTKPLAATRNSLPGGVPIWTVAPYCDSAGHSLASVIASPEYPQQVEFGVKLGYSESLVQLALTKLGLNPDKNELLDELIRLGAGAPRPDSEGESTEGDEHQEEKDPSNLRTIVIDGSSVAMSHGNKTTFSCKGIRLCVDWFRSRGHTDIRVFVPKFRKEASKIDAAITDQAILTELEDAGVLSFTPSRTCSGKRIVAYDDRYILKEALASGGVVVSNDNFRDLATENAGFKKLVEESVLMYSWVGDRFEPPDDPLGRNGPSLDAFLRKAPSGTSSGAAPKDSRPCPYGRKCTYGNKCKYMHPERGAAPIKSVTERLQEHAQKHFQKSRDSSPGETLRAAKSLTLPVSSSTEMTKKPLARTQSNFPSLSHHTHLASQPTSKDEEAHKDFFRPIASLPTANTSSLISPVPQGGSNMHTPVSSQGQYSFDSLRSNGMNADLSFPLRSQGGPFPCGGWQPWGSSHNLDGVQAASSPPQSQRFSSLSADKPPQSKLDSSSSCITGENPHPKLQRQLSINPIGDSRIPNMMKQFEERPASDYSYLSSLSLPHHAAAAAAAHHQQLFLQQKASQHCNDPLSSRSTINAPRCISPSSAYGYANRDLLQPYHPPLTRHSSSQEAKQQQQMSSFSQSMYSPYLHEGVTRNLSAPDPIWGGGANAASGNLHQPLTAMHHKRLNSTSDSRLNIHGSYSDSTHQLLSDPFEDSISSRLPPYTHRSSIGSSLSAVNAPGPGPIGSRPLSPQQSLSSVLHPSPLPSRSGAVQHPSPAAPLHPPLTTSGTHEDERLKIFYHLSQLFPEAQVRSALLKHPDETDPTKICASILSSPLQPPIGSRPISPQQLGGGASLCSGLGGHLPLRGSSSLNSLFSSSTPHEANKESARLEAFSCLTKLFPEDQVHKVLRAYPEETDPIKFIMLLVTLNQS